MAKLPPLPDNNTDRLYIEYTALGQEHSAELRLPAGAGAGSAATAYATFGPLVAALLPTTDFVTGARHSAAGSNLSFPLTVNQIQGTVAAAPIPEHKPNFISWTGRSGDGRRVRFTIFHPYVITDDNYRQPASAGSSTGAVLNALKSGAPAVVTKSNQTPVWNSYMNHGVNSYYQRKLRRTG